MSDDNRSPETWNNAVFASPGPRSWPEAILLYCKGLAMGAADIIPGVSGGTIAFITGIYASLLAAIASINKDFVQALLRFDLKGALSVVHVRFLVCLGCGVGSAIVGLSWAVTYLLQHHDIVTWAFFLGLIAASVIVVGRHIEDLRCPKNLTVVVVGAVFAHFMVNLIPVETPEAHWFVFLCGMIAIMAMILPGISGSFLLLIFGKYEFITGAIKNSVKSPNLADLTTLVVFGCGAVIGLLGFSRILNHLLKRYYSTTMCFLTGVLIGSLQRIWPWREVLETREVRGKIKVIDDRLILPPEMNTEVITAIVLILVGFCGVLFLESRAGHKQHGDTPAA